MFSCWMSCEILNHISEVPIAVRVIGTERFEFADPLEKNIPVLSNA